MMTQDNHIFGYSYELPSGETQFVPLTEGSKAKMDRLKANSTIGDFVKNPVVGIGLEVLPESEVFQ